MKMKSKFLCMALGTLLTAGASMGQVVISQVYGGGGNGGSVYKNDFIEIFNKGTSPVSIAGWSVQYAAATGTTWAVTNIGTGAVTTLQPGQYYLVQEAIGAGGTTNLPTPDATGTIAMSGTAGKVALVSNTTALTGAQTTGTGGAIVDFAGFGTTANGFEGTGPTPAPSNTASVVRAAAGCTDNNNNSADFSTSVLDLTTNLPRNSATALNVCGGTTPPSGSGSSNPTSGCPNVPVVLTFTVTPGVPANPIVSVTADGSSIGAGTITFSNGGSGNVYTANATIDINTVPGAKTLPVTISESARTGSGSIGLTVNTCTFGLTTGTGFSPSTVCAGSDIIFTAVVRKNQINPPGTSTGIAVTLDLAPLGGVNGTAMTDLGDDAGNPNLRNFSYTFTTGGALIPGGYFVQIHASDTQGNNPTLNPFNVNVTNCTPSTSDVVISQFYGGGGATTGAPTYKVDFVELFNRSSAPVDITGWTIQYASATGPSTGTWAKSPDLAGVIPAGGYYLISFAQAANSIGADLAPIVADTAVPLTGGLSMSATDGKVAVVSSNVALTTTTPVDPSIKDLVGYGSATFFEGGNAAPGITNQLSLFRHVNGCQDFDQNGADLFTGTPAPRTSSSPLNNCSGAPSGSCCAPAGTCSPTTQAACVTPSVWTLNGTCTPNTCPQPPSGVCCRGATCNTTLTTAAACSGSISGTPTAGAFFASSAAACNSGAVSNTPCCYANYNKVNGISVQDIFDFLSDWFAGFPYANVGGTGNAGALSVQNIFDFLSNWFAGGC